MEMHADRFVHVICAGGMQAERDTGLIEMGVERAVRSKVLM
jgi:hypothetical protein